MEEPKFNIGRVGFTTLVTKGMERNKDLGLYIEQCLARHQRGDWGDISAEDKKINAEALLNGGRLTSYYVGTNYCRDIIIATDDNRLYTTVMFPQEY